MCVFNDTCNKLSTKFFKVGYAPMITISLFATVKGKFPHLSSIFHNPEPLVKQFNRMLF